MAEEVPRETSRPNQVSLQPEGTSVEDGNNTTQASPCTINAHPGTPIIHEGGKFMSRFGFGVPPARPDPPDQSNAQSTAASDGTGAPSLLEPLPVPKAQDAPRFFAAPPGLIAAPMTASMDTTSQSLSRTYTSEETAASSAARKPTNRP